jgi:hypothetical protein
VTGRANATRLLIGVAQLLDFPLTEVKTWYATEVSMLEGLLHPMHLLVFFFIPVVVGIPAFVVLRLLWRAGTRLGTPPGPPKT